MAMTDTALRPEINAADGPAAGPARRLRPRGVRAGGRYTRFVALMKVALPLAAAMLVLLVAIWPQIEKRSEGFRLGATGVTLTDTDGQRVVNARFNGIDSSGRPFTVTAASATQPESAADAIALDAPKADITTDGGAWIALSADKGAYHRKAETLDLDGNVSGFHDQGYEFRTAAARVDLAHGTAAGDSPVAGHGPLGELKGSGFRLSERGRHIIFTGKSKLTIFPAEKAVGKKAGGK
jgi:lipopolysaccharide export system protein LptC